MKENLTQRAKSGMWRSSPMPQPISLSPLSPRSPLWPTRSSSARSCIIHTVFSPLLKNNEIKDKSNVILIIYLWGAFLPTLVCGCSFKASVLEWAQDVLKCLLRAEGQRMKMSAGERSRTFCQCSETDVRGFFTLLLMEKGTEEVVIKQPIVGYSPLLVDIISSPWHLNLSRLAQQCWKYTLINRALFAFKSLFPNSFSGSMKFPLGLLLGFQGVSLFSLRRKCFAFCLFREL